MEEVVVFDTIESAQKTIPSGQQRLVRIGQRNICLVNWQGTFYAVENACPHMGHPLSQGTLNPFQEIVCPLHTYRFHLKTGEEAERRCKDLQTYQVLQEEKLVIVLDQ